MKFNYRIWLYTEDNNSKVFGKGPYDLLNAVNKYGSLTQAAKNLGISYTKAFTIIKEIEKNLGFKLLNKQAGGINGGKSEITEEAILLLVHYESFIEEANIELNKIYEKNFGDFNTKLENLSRNK